MSEPALATADVDTLDNEATILMTTAAAGWQRIDDTSGRML
jgi:hypothetical protein